MSEERGDFEDDSISAVRVSSCQPLRLLSEFWVAVGGKHKLISSQSQQDI